MRSHARWWPVVGWVIGCLMASVTITGAQTTGVFGAVTVDVTDDQHRPIPDASIALRAILSGWSGEVRADTQGRGSLVVVPAREVMTVTKPGFQAVNQRLVVRSVPSRR